MENENNQFIDKCRNANVLEIAEMVGQIESYDEEGKKIIRDEVNRRNKINNKISDKEEIINENIIENRNKKLYYFIIMCSIFYGSAVLMTGIEETFYMLFTGRNIRMILLFSVLSDVIYVKKNKLKGKDAAKEMSKIKMILLAVVTLLLSNNFSILEMN